MPSNRSAARTRAVCIVEAMEIRRLLSGHGFHHLHGGNHAGAGATVAAVAPAQLVFNPQPGNGVYGSALSPAVTVYVEDQSGNIVTSDNSTVGLSVGGGPAGATLSGTTSVQAVNGVATFNNLFVSAAGAYTLT